jgi:hypothetical protein
MRRKWEYKIVEGGKGMTGGTIRDASTDILNQLGQDGWECYAVNANSMPTIFYLKRER